MNNDKKRIVLLMVIVIFLVMGFRGKSNNEEKVIINKAKEYLVNGEISQAEDILSVRAGETNNKEFKKIWSIVYGYREANEMFNYYNNIDGAKAILSKIDNSYKNYELVREKVDRLKENIENTQQVIEDIDNAIKEIEKLILENKVDEAFTLIKEVAYKDGQTQEQKNTLGKLENKIQKLMWENNDKKNQDIIREENEKFTLEKLEEYIITIIDTSSCRVEIDEQAEYDENERKFYNINTYLIETGDLLWKYKIYSNGKYYKYQDN